MKGTREGETGDGPVSYNKTDFFSSNKKTQDRPLSYVLCLSVILPQAWIYR